MEKFHLLKVANHNIKLDYFIMPNCFVAVVDQQDLEGEHVYTELVHGRVAIPMWLYRGNHQEPHPNIGMYTILKIPPFCGPKEEALLIWYHNSEYTL